MAEVRVRPLSSPDTSLRVRRPCTRSSNASAAGPRGPGRGRVRSRSGSRSQRGLHRRLWDQEAGYFAAGLRRHGRTQRGRDRVGHGGRRHLGTSRPAGINSEFSSRSVQLASARIDEYAARRDPRRKLHGRHGAGDRRDVLDGARGGQPLRVNIDGGLEPLTTDHTMVMEMLANGLINAEQAAVHLPQPHRAV